MFQGRHKGIFYNLKVGIAGNWVWEAQLPDKERIGSFRGSRTNAIETVKRAIDSWHRDQTRKGEAPPMHESR